jgi:fimbrial isopeptide formation D2 family protein/uncharacterized repeat protein (TIGR01451 family)
MKRLPFRRGVVLVLALAVLAATAMALWLGVFRQDQAAASPGPEDLTVSVASDPVSGTGMAEGSVISYVVTVTADAATTAADGDITLEIDLDEATYVTGSLQVSSGITCDTSGLPIDCDVPNFTGSGSKTVSFDATVGATGPVLVGAAIDPIDGGATGEIDEGTGSGDALEDEGDDPDLACAAVGEGSDTAPDDEPDNFDCTSHDVENAALVITKTASPSEATAVGLGSTMVYTLTASNLATATGTASNVAIRDYIGDGLTFVSAAPGTGVTCTDTIPPQINCTAAAIAPGESRDVVIVATVSTASGPVLNGARVDPENVISEDNDDADDDELACAAVGEGSDADPENEPDNYDCTSHAVAPLPDLTISKTASPSETATVDTGDTITYTLTVTNRSIATGTATSVPIRDTIGSGLSLSSVTPGTGVTCADTTAPEINCTATSIAPGESRTVTVVVTVAATSGSVLNGAAVDPEDDIDEINEDDDDPTLDCSDVGEGTDAGSATEADNFDCTSHSLEEATPTPTPGEMVNCPFSGKWAMSVWDGPNDTATATALATCTGVTIQAAYALDRSTNTWSRYFPGRSDINTLLTLDDMQAIFTFGQ